MTALNAILAHLARRHALRLDPDRVDDLTAAHGEWLPEWARGPGRSRLALD